MKRILVLVLFAAVATSLLGAPIPSPSTPRPIVGSPAVLLDDANPMPVKIMSGGSTATGATTIVSATWTTYQTTALTAAPTSVLTTPLSGRKFVALCSLATQTSIWINPGGTTATVSKGIEIPPGAYWADNLADSVSVPYIASVSVPLTKVEAK